MAASIVFSKTAIASSCAATAVGAYRVGLGACEGAILPAHDPAAFGW